MRKPHFGLGPVLLLVVLLLVVLPLVLVSCTPSATSSPVASAAGGPPRIVGTVTALVCPAGASPSAASCTSRPLLEATVVVRDVSGNELGRTSTLADGSYTLPIGQTGPVVVSALVAGGFTQPPDPVTVTLTSPGDVERVDLVFAPKG